MRKKKPGLRATPFQRQRDLATGTDRKSGGTTLVTGGGSFVGVVLSGAARLTQAPLLHKAHRTARSEHRNGVLVAVTRIGSRREPAP